MVILIISTPNNKGYIMRIDTILLKNWWIEAFYTMYRKHKGGEIPDRKGNLEIIPFCKLRFREGDEGHSSQNLYLYSSIFIRMDGRGEGSCIMQ